MPEPGRVLTREEVVREAFMCGRRPGDHLYGLTPLPPDLLVRVLDWYRAALSAGEEKL